MIQVPPSLPALQNTLHDVWQLMFGLANFDNAIHENLMSNASRVERWKL